jgi:hypothetical protein
MASVILWYINIHLFSILHLKQSVMKKEIIVIFF